MKKKFFVTDIENCMSEIKLWMECNMLKLNGDKTEFLVLKSKDNTNLFVGTNVQVAHQ